MTFARSVNSPRLRCAGRPSLLLRKKEGGKYFLPSFPLAEERQVERSHDRVSKRSATDATSEVCVRDCKGLARRRRGRSEAQPCKARPPMNIGATPMK